MHRDFSPKPSILSFASLFTLTLLSISKPGFAYINNGIETDPATLTPVVQIVMKEDRLPVGVCTGTIISPTKVLTAAHCVMGPSKETQEATQLDAYNLEVYGIRNNVISISVHPKYIEAQSNYEMKLKRFKEFYKKMVINTTYGRDLSPIFTPQDQLKIASFMMLNNPESELKAMAQSDLAILTLLKPADQFFKVSFKTPVKGQEVQLAGYGISGIEEVKQIIPGQYFPKQKFFDQFVPKNHNSGTLRVGKNTIDDVSDGLIEFAGVMEDHRTLFGFGWYSANGKDATSNHGDSGGPLLVNQTVVGVVHAGGFTDSGDALGCIYTSVSSPLNKAFIQAELAK